MGIMNALASFIEAKTMIGALDDTILQLAETELGEAMRAAITEGGETFGRPYEEDVD
jgi:hypothetical protein